MRLPSCLFLALILASSCGHGPSAPPGKGLELLADEGPLGRGVEERDPRLNFHDFGRVLDGDEAVHVFRLRNTDPRPVAIKRVTPGCGCTVAALRAVRADGSVVPGEPIASKAEKLLSVAPGDVAEIEVRIATRALATKNADKLVTISVSTDSPNAFYFSLEVHIFVEKPFEVVPGTLALGPIPENGGGEGRVEIVQAGPILQVLTELQPPPAGVHAELSREDRNGRPFWTLRAGFDPPLTLGLLRATLRIATQDTQGAPGRELEVPLMAQGVPDLAAEPERLVFAAPRAASITAAAEVFSRLSGHRLRVLGVEVPEAQRSFLAAHVQPLEPDDAGSSLRWKVELETRPPLPEEPVLTGELRLALDDPQHPSLVLPYVVHVRQQ